MGLLEKLDCGTVFLTKTFEDGVIHKMTINKVGDIILGDIFARKNKKSIIGQSKKFSISKENITKFIKLLEVEKWKIDK